MTTPNRKRLRLLQKLKSLPDHLLALKVAPRGSSAPSSPSFDPDALYLSRQLLIDLLTEGVCEGALRESFGSQTTKRDTTADHVVPSCGGDT